MKPDAAERLCSKTEQTNNKSMNTMCYNETLHYRKADALVRLTSLYDWRKYNITSAPRDPRCTVIRVGDGDNLIIYLREVQGCSGWDIDFRQTFKTISGNNKYITVIKGRTSHKRDVATTFIWSVLSNLSSRNPKDFNEREHELFRKISYHFRLYNLDDLISDWKANAKG